MSIRDFCDRYNVGRTTANQEIKEGRLKARKARRRTLIGDDDAEEWWDSLPEINEAAGEVALESLTPNKSAGDPKSTQCGSSVPMGEVGKPLIPDESPSASRLVSATTKHAALRRRRRRPSPMRGARGPPSSESKNP
jgi:hypothetical protein